MTIEMQKMVIAILFFSGNDCNSDYALVLTLSEFSSQLVASGCQWSELGITEAAPLNTQIPSELPQYFPSKYKIQRLLPHETGGGSFRLIKISGGESVRGQIRIFGEKVILLCVGHLLIKEKQFVYHFVRRHPLYVQFLISNDQKSIVQHSGKMKKKIGSGFLTQSFDSGKQNNPLRICNNKEPFLS